MNAPSTIKVNILLDKKQFHEVLKQGLNYLCYIKGGDVDISTSNAIMYDEGVVIEIELTYKLKQA